MKDYNQAYDLEKLQECGIGYQDAIDCLKACGNDVAKAAEYFYSGNLEKAREQRRSDSLWNEGQFHTDRYDATLEPLTGPWGQSGGSSHYSIQGGDVLTPEVLGAQRPSSPINSALITDTNRDQDADLERAIQASLHNNYPEKSNLDWDGQETGIIGNHSTPTGGVTFGPALRDHYDEAQWGVTTTAHEIYLDPVSPQDRKRKSGEPSFFKPSSVGYNLGPAFTIFHSIPAARQAIMAPELARDDYGYNEKWWSGERIEGSRIINIDVDKEEPELGEVVIESQRLMAFLSQTTRAYGSIDSLARLPDVLEHQQGQQLSTFFRKWTSSLEIAGRNMNVQLSSPFTSRVLQVNSQNPEQGESIPFQLLEVQLNEELVRKNATIYDAIDALMWGHNSEGLDVYIGQRADVMCIAILRDTADSRGAGIAIPAQFYIDRYTKEFKDLVDQTKVQREELLQTIQKIEESEGKFTQCRRENLIDESPMDTSKLLEAAIEHFERKPVSSIDMADSVIVDSAPGGKLQPISRIGSLLKDVLDNLERQLQSLSLRKEEAYKTLSELTSRFTSPETTPPDAPDLHKYTLRGVCPDPSVTFVCIPSVALEEAQSAEILDTMPTISGDQWWSISWRSQQGWGQDLPYEVRRVLEQDVLEAARYTGDGKVLLVYATEEGMKPREDELPKSLKKFVEQDNQAFEEELFSFPGDKGKRKRSSGNWWTQDDARISQISGTEWGPTFTIPRTDDLAFVSGSENIRGISPKRKFEGGLADDTLSEKFTPGNSRRNSAIELEDSEFNAMELSNWQTVDSKTYGSWENRSPPKDDVDGYAFSGNIVARPGISVGDSGGQNSAWPTIHSTDSEDFQEFQELVDTDEVMSDVDQRKPIGVGHGEQRTSPEGEGLAGKRKNEKQA